MSPMPTPEWMAHLEDMRRAGRRADGEKQTPDRSDADHSTSGVRPDLPDPHLLDDGHLQRLDYWAALNALRDEKRRLETE